MSYEMFEQGPEVYVPFLILSLLITVIAYCAFPLIFAITRKTPIEKKKYSKYCYITNAVIAVIFLILNGGAVNFAPYILWTSIFVAVGNKILEKKRCYIRLILLKRGTIRCASFGIWLYNIYWVTYQ